MTDLSLKRLLLGSTLLVSLSATTAFAQNSSTTGTPEADDEVADGVFEQTITDEERVDIIEEVVDGDVDELVVTGSRLKRDTFSSITPLQVIDTDFAAEQGLFNPVEILQSSSASAGQQIDSTFGGFVLDNGPGSETANLRGLGAGRTLIVMDGRRVSPGGVEGAPSQPSINLIPQTFVERYDILLDGASSVYGSDAVAGVINAQLKRDFDGLEADFRTELPEQGGGESYVGGVSYGINGERGFIGVQGEYRFQDNFKIADRDFFNDCETFLEQDAEGNIRTVDTVDQFFGNQIGLDVPVSSCRETRLAQRIIVPNNFGSIYYQPGIGNTGIDGFSESTLFGVPLDGNSDGVRDVNFFEFSPNGQQQDQQDFINQQEQISARVVGEYVFEGEANITPYVDVMFTRLETERVNRQGQFFPDVPADNFFNPCNIDSPNGQDCNEAYNDVLTSPEYVALFQQALNNPLGNTFGTNGVDVGGTADCFGRGFTDACTPAAFGLLTGTGTSLSVLPVVTVNGDRNRIATELDQTRLVGGVKGDIPGLEFGPAGDFSWDVHGVYTYSNGNAVRPGIREDRLALALGLNPFDSTGAYAGLDSDVSLDRPCAAPAGLAPTITNGCVPVNLFAPSLYTTSAGGDFATQAERDYLFDDRDFATQYEQALIDGSIQGDLFELPGGSVSAIVGAQIRWDDINSEPDDVARDGLFFGFFVDGGAAGDRVTKELYGEVSIPLGTGKMGLREFNVDLAGRLTDDEFYGTNETYSVKAGWRPIDSLLMRATYGTSFRAPTVRELFLRNQSGFGNVTDPCGVPDAAFGSGLGGENSYSRADDPRTDITLDNCRQAGIDPETFREGNPVTNVEINRTNNLDLNPEESTSLTLGASFDQPFTDAFELEIGATYYEYDIDDTFVELDTGSVLRNCYVEVANLAGEFCQNITRDADGNLDNFLLNFVNRENDTVRGVDINVDGGIRDVNVFGQNVDFSLTSGFNRLLERTFTFDLDGETATEELLGDFSFARWQGRATASAAVDKFRFAWTVNYEGKVEVDQGLDQQGNPELGTPEATNFVDARYLDAVVGGVNTSAGPGFGDVNVLPISRADAEWLHAATLTYRHNEDMSFLFGVNNLFDNEPPLVDPSEVFSVNNVAIGSGYDYNGRSFFARVQTRF